VKDYAIKVRHGLVYGSRRGTVLSQKVDSLGMVGTHPENRSVSTDCISTFW